MWDNVCVGDVGDERIVGRAVFGFEYLSDGFGFQSIASQAVNGFGGNGYEFVIHQIISGDGEVSTGVGGDV